MSTIDDIRAKYPQYNDLTDQQVADGIHAKYYPDTPPEQFYAKIGFDPRVNKRTTEGMSTGESIGELSRTGAQYGLAKTEAIPHDIATAEMTHFSPEDLKQAHDEWVKANPNRGIGPYTYMPEMYDRAKEIALARDPNSRRPIFGKTVHDYAQQHMMSADDLLADMAKNLSVTQGKPYEFTRPTEWSGRVLQKGVEGATAAAPALVAGPAGLSA